MKRVFFFIFIIFFNGSMLFANKNITFNQNNEEVSIILNKVPAKFSVNYYDYGANIFVENLKLNRLIIKKFSNGTVVKILPLSNKKSLIKITSSFKNLQKHILISEKNSNFKITVRNNILPNKKNENKEAVKDSEANITDEIDGKSIVDVAKEYAMLKEKKEAKEPIKKEEKKINKTNKFVYENTEKYDFSKNVVKTYSILGVLCLFIITLALLFRKFKHKIKLKTYSKSVKVIYSEEIFPKKRIAIVKIFNEYYILGITEAGISMVDKISSDSVSEELKVIEKNGEQDKFIKYLKNEEKKENKKVETETEKDKLIKLIQGKLRNYQQNMNL